MDTNEVVFFLILASPLLALLGGCVSVKRLGVIEKSLFALVLICVPLVVWATGNLPGRVSFFVSMAISSAIMVSISFLSSDRKIVYSSLFVFAASLLMGIISSRVPLLFILQGCLYVWLSVLAIGGRGPAWAMALVIFLCQLSAIHLLRQWGSWSQQFFPGAMVVFLLPLVTSFLAGSAVRSASRASRRGEGG